MSEAGETMIIGAGFLGLRLLEKLLGAGSQPLASCRQAARSEVLVQAGGRALIFDVNKAASWPTLLASLHTPCDVYFLLPPGKIDLDSLQAFLQELAQRPVRRLVMSSSTVVYGSELDKVDADSAVDMRSRRATRQYAIEQACLDILGDRARIVRLAGLYGATRMIGRRAVSAGAVLPGSAEKFLNLLHLEDAAALLQTLMASESARQTELGSDGCPVRRGQYYADLAVKLGAPPPRFAKSAEQGASGRQCDIKATCRRTGWQPQHTDYRLGWLQP